MATASSFWQHIARLLVRAVGSFVRVPVASFLADATISHTVFKLVDDLFQDIEHHFIHDSKRVHVWKYMYVINCTESGMHKDVMII